MATRLARTREVGATSAAPTVADLTEALDAEVRAAIADVDRTLIALSLADPLCELGEGQGYEALLPHSESVIDEGRDPLP